MELNIESLPEHYMMTGKFENHDDFKNKLSNALSESKKIVQFRQKSIDNDEYLALVEIAETLCNQYECLLLLGTSANVFEQTNASGLHLNSKVLFEYEDRPVASHQVLSVSCHDLDEMKQAEKLGADILMLSPVKPTASHPELEGIGWKKFAQMIKQVKCPVYALGGMQASDLDDAKQSGAQGIAVSSFWK
ncbi:MAG: thiamine phosphate synthase [Gammaproteobacteria bacterium]|nr:thiamine phosphate synthase [Gammaproteobacteria bacterium]